MEKKNLKIEKENGDRSANVKKKKGLVVSDKMDKTVVVSVTNVKIHSKYQKRYKSTDKYKVHDENNECKVGDWICFTECRPLSKEKRWRFIEKISKITQNKDN